LPAPKKSKKSRSEAQVEAFARMRKRKAEIDDAWKKSDKAAVIKYIPEYM
jgi:hypothetical protein